MTKLVDDATVVRLGAQLQSSLQDLETLRRAERSRALRRVAVLIGLGSALSAAGWVLNDDPEWVVLGLLVVAIGIRTWAWGPYTQFKDKAAETIMPAICAALGGLAYTRRPARYDRIQHFVDAGVVPSHNQPEVVDLLRGRHRGTDFEMTQAVLRVRGGRSTDTKFRGLLFAIAVPRDIPGPILIARDEGSVGNAAVGMVKRFADLTRVRFDHVGFEERFEVYARDPEAARGALVPSLLDTFCVIDDAFDRQGLQAAFVGRDFLMAVKTDTALTDPLSFLDPLGRPDAIVSALADRLTVAHRVIDYLHGDRPDGRQPAAGAGKPLAAHG